MKINPLLMTDFYKISHRIMNEEGTEQTYSTFTPRTSRIKEIDKVVFFGLQGFIKEYLIDYFTDNFFKRDKSKVVSEYKRIIKYTLGDSCADTSHIEALHDLGYLPIKIRGLKEGTLAPIKVPVFTIENTHKDFYWLTNFLETLISACMWKVITATTIVKQYYDICNQWADKTCDSKDFLQWQCHNFSYRGMSGNEDAITTGAGQLLFFTGTDTIPSIQYLENYYNANVENELVGASVLATEHSIQTQYKDDYRYFKRMITEVAPQGILSLVADGFDYWNVIGTVVPSLKEEILARNGKVVIRPDSGNPIAILCGSVDVIKDDKYLASVEDIEDYFNDLSLEYFADELEKDSYVDEKTFYCEIGGKTYKVECVADIIRERGGYTDSNYYFVDSVKVAYKEVELTLEQKGSVEALYDTFGGNTNSKGYKVLDSHVGLIYGDAITPAVANEILKRLEKKGFASENVVFGIGSYSLGFHTRDTFGFAVKATQVVINGEERNIFKDPKTDDGTKKSLTGRVAVFQGSEELLVVDGLTIEEQNRHKPIDLLEDVFVDGKLVRNESLAEIRARLKGA